MPLPLVDAGAWKLWELIEGEEAALTGGAHRPLTHALCVIQHEERILLVHDKRKGQWELPGGVIEAGESAGEAAIRETWEESNQRPLEVWFRGLMRYTRDNAGMEEYGALYCGRLSQVYEFRANQETDAITWWLPGEALPGLHPIDGWLAGQFRGERV